MDHEEEKLDKYILENCKEAINYEDFVNLNVHFILH
jgi:hypothetical protein